MGFVLDSPKGEIRVISSISKQGDTLILEGLHVEGPGANAVGKTGVRQFARDIGRTFGVKEVIIHGGQRTTGANPGRTPTPIRIRVKP